MHGLDSRRPRNFFSSSFLALGLLDLFAELHDLVILVDLRAAVSGEGALAHLSVLLRPPPERRILDSKLTRKLDGLHLAAEDNPRRRYLELLIVTLSLLGQLAPSNSAGLM